MPFIQRVVAGALLPLAFTLTLQHAHAAGPRWPQLEGSSQQPVCKAALQMAGTIFKTSAFNLWDSEPFHVWMLQGLSFGLRIFESPTAGGPEIAHPERFTRHASPGGPNNWSYWHEQTDQGFRLVIDEWEAAPGQRVYGARMIPANEAPIQHFATRAGENNGEPEAHPPAWTSISPLVFDSEAGDKPWLAQVRRPADFLPRWHVLVPRSGRLVEACRIRFRPDVRHATALLPPPVQRLAALLERSMSANAGTAADPSATPQKILIEQAWANAALRPWALGEPANSRESADADLAAWAGQAPARQATYAEIQARYPSAERALAAHYRAGLGMPAEQAESTAHRALDVLVRLHHVRPPTR